MKNAMLDICVAIARLRLAFEAHLIPPPDALVYYDKYRAQQAMLPVAYYGAPVYTQVDISQGLVNLETVSIAGFDIGHISDVTTKSFVKTIPQD